MVDQSLNNVGPVMAGATQRNREGIDQRSARELEDALTFLALCERSSINGPDGMAFDGAILFGTEGVIPKPDHSQLTEEFIRSDARWFGVFAFLPNGVNPLRLLRAREERGDRMSLRGAFIAQRYCPPGFTPLIVEAFEVHDDGKLRLEVTGYGARKGNAVREMRSVGALSNAVRTIFAQTAYTMAVVRREWVIQVRPAPDCPSLGFITDPTGVKEFLKFRDNPDGKARRDALIHWVNEHWRQNRRDPDVEHYVRAYLRGKTDAAWHGLHARVHVPEEDLRAVEEAKAARKRMSYQQIDRRLRKRGGA
jgi:hypothetical protein